MVNDKRVFEPWRYTSILLTLCRSGVAVDPLGVPWEMGCVRTNSTARNNGVLYQLNGLTAEMKWIWRTYYLEVLWWLSSKYVPIIDEFQIFVGTVWYRKNRYRVKIWPTVDSADLRSLQTLAYVAVCGQWAVVWFREKKKKQKKTIGYGGSIDSRWNHRSEVPASDIGAATLLSGMAANLERGDGSMDLGIVAFNLFVDLVSLVRFGGRCLTMKCSKYDILCSCEIMRLFGCSLVTFVADVWSTWRRKLYLTGRDVSIGSYERVCWVNRREMARIRFVLL